MPPIVPFLPAIAKTAGPLVAGLIGGKLGKKKGAGAADAPPINPAYAQPLQQFGSSLLPMAQKSFQSAFDYQSGVLADPTMATASGAADIGRQTQQLTDRAARTMPRGGAMASLVGALPQQQMAGVLDV